MPAIRNYSLKISFSTLLLLVSFSCDKKTGKAPIINSPNEITFISLSNIGGDLGNYRIIKVTKDSIHLEKGIAAHKIHQQWSSTINPEIWKNLISSIEIEDLDYIKSSPSIQPVEGIDETFQIKTSKKSHVYVNSYNDTIHYRQLQKFKDRLEKILPKEYQ